MFKQIVIPSIYRNSSGQRVVLPKRMALLESCAAHSLNLLANHITKIGGELYLSDAYRTREMQSKAREDYTSGRKSAFSPAAGESIHEAGRAIDIDVDSLRIELSHFWEIASLYGWRPIISTPSRKISECWHFEYLAYWYREDLLAAFRKCSILEAYLENNICTLSESERCFLLQGYLKLMNFYTLALDGIAGPGTREAIEDYKKFYGEQMSIVAPDIVVLGQRMRDRWRHRKA